MLEFAYGQDHAGKRAIHDNIYEYILVTYKEHIDFLKNKIFLNIFDIKLNYSNFTTF